MEGRSSNRDARTQLTVAEAAEYLGVDAKAIYAYLHNGELPNAWNKAENPKSDRARYRIPVADLDALKRSRMVRAAPPPPRRRRRHQIPDIV